MMQNKSRALRRHHSQRMKRKAIKVFPHDKEGRRRDYLSVCSCPACGNPRKWFKEKTMQEKRADDFTRHFDD